MKKSLSKKPLKKVFQRPNIDPSLLKIGEAAKILGVSIDSLRRWEKAGKISTVKTAGGTRFYPAEELNRIRPGAVKIESIKIDQTPSTEELLKKISNQTSPSSSLQDHEVTKQSSQLNSEIATSDLHRTRNDVIDTPSLPSS